MALASNQPERTVILQDQALRRLKGFTQVPNAVLRHPTLSHGAKLTFGVLLSYAWQDDFCHPAQEKLAGDMGCSIRQVRRFLVELRTFHFVGWKQQGLNRPNVYLILPQARWAFGTTASAEGTDVTVPDRTDLSHPERTSAADLERTPMSDKEYSKKNTHVDNVDESFPGKKMRKPRRLTRDEYAQATGLALQIQDTIGQPENYRFYFTRAAEAVRRGHRGVQALMEALSITKGKLLQRDLKKTPSQYFHGTWERMLPALGPELPAAPRSAPASGAATTRDPVEASLAVQKFLARPRTRPANAKEHPHGHTHED